jgi:hypothetical protein
MKDAQLGQPREARRDVLRSPHDLAQVRVVGFHEERHVGGKLPTDDQAHATDEEVLLVTTGRGVLGPVGLGLEERAQLEVDVLADRDHGLRRGGSRKQAEGSGGDSVATPRLG